MHARLRFLRFAFCVLPMSKVEQGSHRFSQGRVGRPHGCKRAGVVAALHPLAQRHRAAVPCAVSDFHQFSIRQISSSQITKFQPNRTAKNPQHLPPFGSQTLTFPLRVYTPGIQSQFWAQTQTLISGSTSHAVKRIIKERNHQTPGIQIWAQTQRLF